MTEPTVLPGALYALITPEGEKLAREALRLIKLDPGSWDQTTWGRKTPCGSTACFAGHVDMVAGAEMVPYESDSDMPYELHAVYRFKGNLYSADELAINLLGVEPYSGYALFNGVNDLEDLERMVNDLAAGRAIADPPASVEDWGDDSDAWDQSDYVDDYDYSESGNW